MALIFLFPTNTAERLAAAWAMPRWTQATAPGLAAAGFEAIVDLTNHRFMTDEAGGGDFLIRLD